MNDRATITVGSARQTPIAREQQLEAIVEEYSSRLRAGDAPDPYELMVLHLSLARELEERLQVVDLLHAQRPLPANSLTPQAPANAVSALAPLRIGRYELRERLGAGASAVVYRAWDSRLEREVALKVLRTEVLEDASIVERFDREAPIVARLRHPNIVWLHESGEADGHRYLDMELVAGRSLARRLREQPRLPIRESAQLISRLADALDYAHSKGIVHRDVAPTNILLDEEDQPQLADFGLARRIDVCQTLTLQGQLLGTPAYMSPEQAAGGGRTADRRSDIYSLGVVLYQLLSDRLPFEPGDSYAHLVHQIIHATPTPLRAHTAAIPAVLEAICLKALEKDPADRFQTAGEFGDELRRWLNDEPSLLRRPGPLQIVSRWARRHRAVAWTLTPALAVLFVVLGYALRQRALNVVQSRSAAHAEIVGRHDAIRQRLRDPKVGRQAEAHWLLEQVAAQRPRLLAGGETDRLDLQTRSLLAWSLATPEFIVSEQAALPGVFHRSWPVAIKPDGQSLAIGTATRPVVWKRGGPLKLPPGMSDPVPGSRLAFSPDGRYLICAPDAGRVEAWDAEAAKLIGQWKPDQAPLVLALGFSADARIVTACTANGAVHCLSMPALEIDNAWPLEPIDARWTAAAFTADTKLLARGNSGGQVEVHAADGRLVAEIDADATQIETLAWTPDGESVAVGARGGVVRLWNLATRQPSKPFFVGPTGVGSIVVTPDGARLVAGARHNETKTWDIATGRLLMEGIGPTGDSVSQNGRFLAAGCKDIVAFCELAPSACVREWSGHEHSIQQVVWSSDSSRVATIDSGFQIHVWDLESARPIWSKAAPSEELFAHGSNAGLAFSEDGKLLAYASGGNRVSHLFVADLESGALLWQGDLPGGYEHLVGNGRDRFVLVREQFDQGHRLWNSVLYQWQAGHPPELATVVRQGQPGETGFFDGELSRDGKLYIWGGPRRPLAAQRLEIWEIATSQVRRIQSPTRLPSDETNFSLSEDARLLHVVTQGGDSRTMDLQTGQQQPTRGGPVALSAGGHWLLTMTAAGIQLCPDRQESAPWIEFTTRDKDPLSISGAAVHFSPCGRFLAWGDNVGALRIAELAAWQRSLSQWERQAGLP